MNHLFVSQDAEVRGSSRCTHLQSRWSLWLETLHLPSAPEKPIVQFVDQLCLVRYSQEDFYYLKHFTFWQMIQSCGRNKTAYIYCHKTLEAAQTRYWFWSSCPQQSYHRGKVSLRLKDKFSCGELEHTHEIKHTYASVLNTLLSATWARTNFWNFESKFFKQTLKSFDVLRELAACFTSPSSSLQ